MRGIWKFKALIQKTVSYMPFGNQINYLLQKHITKGVRLTDEHFKYKLEHARDHIFYLKKYGKINENKILELGTGWYPIIPLFLFLTNSGQVITIDIHRWMTKVHQLIAINKIIEWRESGKLKTFFNEIDEKNWAVLVKISISPDRYTLDEINYLIRLSPIIQDAQNLSLEANSIDFICSNNTFEHINEKILIKILKEFKRICKKDAAMSHFIDMSDHFAHFDKSISIYNFLKFGSRKWNLIDNRIQPQSRLRFIDYLNIYENLDIYILETSVREGDLVELAKINIHKEFKKYSKEELAVSHGYIVSKFK